MGNARFCDVSALSNADSEGDGRSAVPLDWDDDGRLDLLLRSRSGPRVQLFHNRYKKAGTFLVFELVGNGKTCNRDAIGAVVTVEVEGRVQRRTLRAGEGYLAQSSKRLHFGLDHHGEAERVTVDWPDGTRTELGPLEADARYRIVQAAGDAPPVRIEARGTSLTHTPHRPIDPAEGKARRVVLGYELPLAPVQLPSYADPLRRVGDLAGGPVLVNFWRKECAGCYREFSEFYRQRENIAALGVRIVPMNADPGLEEAKARSFLARFELDGPDTGYQDERLRVVLFETLYRHVFGPRSNLDVVLPTSFLVDAEAQLVAIYHGPVSVAQLTEDVRRLTADEPGSSLDRMSSGRRLIHFKRDFAGLADELEAKGFGELAEFYREVDGERRSFFYADGEKRFLVE